MKHETNRDPDHFSVWSARGTTYIRMPIIVFIGGLLALATLTILFWSVKRKPHIELRVENPGELGTLLPSLIGLTHSTLDDGNTVEVLQNGDGFFPPLFRDIAAATESVHIETFIWYDGDISRQLSELLARKARQGVAVRVLADASGGRQLRGRTEDLLEQSGADVTFFHPIRISNLGRLNNRDHRKLMIIDGRIAYVAGHGIADSWIGNARSRKQYRDTALRLTGPVVNRIQSVFTENWVEETGEILADDSYFPRLPATGNTPAHVAYTSPAGSVSAVQVLHYVAIAAARREIIIQNPYLLPDRDAMAALGDAVRRGVKVRIMVPSAAATDNAIVQHASHHHYGRLLERGVEIYEYEKTLLHQKVVIVDGVWSAVGSTNFDDRSFQLNDEVTVGVLDTATAAKLRAAFEADLRHAKRQLLDEWRQRPLWHKAVDGVAYLGRSQM